MKRALSLLRKNKSEDPDTIKNDFFKYEGEAIAILLKDYFQQILKSFYLLWKRGIRGKLWRIMHKLNNNQETRVMTKFALTDTIVSDKEVRSQAQNVNY